MKQQEAKYTIEDAKEIILSGGVIENDDKDKIWIINEILNSDFVGGLKYYSLGDAHDHLRYFNDYNTVIKLSQISQHPEANTVEGEMEKADFNINSISNIYKNINHLPVNDGFSDFRFKLNQNDELFYTKAYQEWAVILDNFPGQRKSFKWSVPIKTYSEFEFMFKMIGVELLRSETSTPTPPLKGEDVEAAITSLAKKCFYKGFEKATNDDANCFTAWREESAELLKDYNSQQSSSRIRELEQALEVLLDRTLKLSEGRPIRDLDEIIALAQSKLKQ